MNATIDDTEVRAYLEALKPHLVDLPEDERSDLLEDLEQHLREVAAEGDGTLEERLGSPAAYAAELRASVGFPPSEPTPLARRIADRLAHSSLARGVESAASAKPVRAVREFLPELRPGWWVLRGYLLVAGPAIVLRPYPQLSSDFPIPFLGSHIVGLAAVAIGIWGSVAIARRSSNDRWSARLSRAATLAAIAFGIAALPHLGNAAMVVVPSASPEPGAYLQQLDGQPITNICPYASDGTSLNGVLLFDQDGRPITNIAPPDSQAAPSIPNAYPQRQSVVDPSTGGLKPVSCPAIVSPASPKTTAGSVKPGATATPGR